MKTAISVPDDVFERAEALARRERRSRSEVYSTAMREYIARHATDDVTDALDLVVADVGEAPDPFVQIAAARVLAASDW
jgi:predicted transcriptional regulator